MLEAFILDRGKRISLWNIGSFQIAWSFHIRRGKWITLWNLELFTIAWNFCVQPLRAAMLFEMYNCTKLLGIFIFDRRIDFENLELFRLLEIVVFNRRERIALWNLILKFLQICIFYRVKRIALWNWKLFEIAWDLYILSSRTCYFVKFRIISNCPKLLVTGLNKIQNFLKKEKNNEIFCTVLYLWNSPSD